MTEPTWQQPPAEDVQDPVVEPPAVDAMPGRAADLAPYRPVREAEPADDDRGAGAVFMDNYHDSLAKTPWSSLAGAGLALLIGLVTMFSGIGALAGRTGLVTGGAGSAVFAAVVGALFVLLGAVGMMALFRRRQ